MFIIANKLGFNRVLIDMMNDELYVTVVQKMFQVSGQNFPTKEKVPDWPVNYIPIPVHTVNYGTDYVSHTSVYSKVVVVLGEHGDLVSSRDQ